MKDGASAAPPPPLEYSVMAVSGRGDGHGNDGTSLLISDCWIACGLRGRKVMQASECHSRSFSLLWELVCSALKHGVPLVSDFEGL